MCIIRPLFTYIIVQKKQTLIIIDTRIIMPFTSLVLIFSDTLRQIKVGYVLYIDKNVKAGKTYLYTIKIFLFNTF